MSSSLMLPDAADLELLELLAPHVSPTSHPLALYELLGACAKCSSIGESSVCALLAEVTADAALERRQQEAAKALRKTARAGGWRVNSASRRIVPCPPLSQRQQGLGQKKQGHVIIGVSEGGKVEGLLRLVTRLLEGQEGEQSWADATAAALSVPPAYGGGSEPPTALHLAASMGLSTELIQVPPFHVTHLEVFFVCLRYALLCVFLSVLLNA